jgi:hypothetical protein
MMMKLEPPQSPTVMSLLSHRVPSFPVAPAAEGCRKNHHGAVHYEMPKDLESTVIELLNQWTKAQLVLNFDAWFW